MNIIIIEQNTDEKTKDYYEGIGMNILSINNNYRKAITSLKDNKNNIDFIILDSNNSFNKDILEYVSNNNIKTKIIMNFNKKDNQFEFLTYEIEIQISEILYKIGFSPKYKGYEYIKEIIVQMKLDYHNNIEHYYELLSQKYSKNKKDIESSIRYAIDICLARGNLIEINSIFNYMENDNKLRPSNKEFIYTIYEILK